MPEEMNDPMHGWKQVKGKWVKFDGPKKKIAELPAWHEVHMAAQPPQNWAKIPQKLPEFGNGMVINPDYQAVGPIEQPDAPEKPKDEWAQYWKDLMPKEKPAWAFKQVGLGDLQPDDQFANVHAIPPPGKWDINHVYHWDEWEIRSPFEVPLPTDFVCKNGKQPWDFGNAILTAYCAVNKKTPAEMWPDEFINYPYQKAVYRPPAGWGAVRTRDRARSNPIFRARLPIP